MRPRPITRFFNFVDISAGGCWLWTGTKITGYGQFRVGDRKHYAHRWLYEQLVGPIPEGLQLDHLCRVRNCVCPDHLEPVTCRENLLRGETVNAINARKTHCHKGHPFTPENTYRNPKGQRVCLTCRRIYDREWKRERRERNLAT